MKWRIDYSREAEKFIESQDIRADVSERLKKVPNENERWECKH